MKGCETGPLVYSPYSRRLESLTICGCNFKGSTLSSVIPLVLVLQESNSRPPAWQPSTQTTKPWHNRASQNKFNTCFFDHQHYPCVVVVGLGKKDVESDNETSEECERTANFRLASAGEIRGPFFIQ